jgi:hypothetical protein
LKSGWIFGSECIGVEMEYKYKIMLRRHDLKQLWISGRARRAGSGRPSQAEELLSVGG